MLARRDMFGTIQVFPTEGDPTRVEITANGRCRVNVGAFEFSDAHQTIAHLEELADCVRVGFAKWQKTKEEAEG